MNLINPNRAVFRDEYNKKFDDNINIKFFYLNICIIKINLQQY